MIEHLRSPLDPNKEDPENDGADNGNPSLDLRPVPTIIMDAGIASEENIQWLQDHGYKYIVVSRKRHMEFDEERCVAVTERENDRCQCEPLSNSIGCHDKRHLSVLYSGGSQLPLPSSQ